MREKRKGNAFEAKPKKVGYFQYRRLEKQFYAPYAGQLSVPLDKETEFRSKYRPWGLVYGIRWLIFVLPHRIDNRLWAYRVRHFPLGKQKYAVCKNSPSAAPSERFTPSERSCRLRGV